MTAKLLGTMRMFVGSIAFAACTGGERAAETQAEDRPEAEAVEEQEELETGHDDVQPPAGVGQPGPEPAERSRPRTERGAAPGAEPAESAGAAAQPRPGAPAEGAATTGAPQEGDTTVEGVIAVTGTAIEARPVLQTADGTLGVIGDLTPELRRLSGARVRVEGVRRAGRLPGESIDVSSYTVLEVNGERPEVGTIVLRDDAPWLVGADTIRLIGASDRLASLDAAKVWVTGRRTDQGLEVTSYGVIRR